MCILDGSINNGAVKVDDTALPLAGQNWVNERLIQTEALRSFKSYFRLPTVIDLSNQLFLQGLLEMLSRFCLNVYLYICGFPIYYTCQPWYIGNLTVHLMFPVGKDRLASGISIIRIGVRACFFQDSFISRSDMTTNRYVSTELSITKFVGRTVC